MTTVTRLLTESRAAHERYRRAVQGHIKVGAQVLQRTPNYADADAACVDALRLRLEADAADPEHADPAWQLDAVSHDELVLFYRTYTEQA